MKILSVLIIVLSASMFALPFIYKQTASSSKNYQRVVAHNAMVAQQTPKPIKPKLPPFKFEEYPDKAAMEIALKKYLYSEDAIEEIDRVLVAEGGAFRSDNLLSYKKDDSDYQFGTSSAENYVFYFKPSVPAGEHGWNEADDGWILKVIYMGTGRGFLGGNMDMAPAGLFSVETLSTPSDKNADATKLVKGLLQDKLDREPKDKFSQEEWNNLKDNFLKSPCMANPSFQCLVEHSISALELNENPLAVLYYPDIAKVIISEGNASLANTLLQDWPNNEKITAFEESLPRTKQYVPNNRQSQFDNYTYLRMRLLYVAGDYEQADKLLQQSHSAIPNGEDFGAIVSLVKKGDLDKALAIAKHTLAWSLEGRDPREGSSAIGHCNSYEESTLRAQAMGELGLAFIEKGDYQRAHEVLSLLKTYIENKAYGQKSPCHLSFANASYVRLAKALILYYADQKDKDSARRLLNEQVDVLIAQNPKITNYNYGAFERIAKLSAAVGLHEPIQRLVEHMIPNLQVKYNDLQHKPHDPVVVVLALAKNYASALGRMVDADYEKNPVPLDKMEELIKVKPIPNNAVNLNTLMESAKSLKDVGDSEGSAIFLEKAHSAMGIRKPEYDPAVENISDYVDRANMYYDLGLKDKSKSATEEILKLFDATSAQDYRGGQVTTNFFGDIALLIAKHETVQDLQAWSNKLPYFYAGHAYADIGKLFVKEKRWEELDIFMPEMARVFSIDNQPPSNWERFTEALIEEKDFDRFTKFFAMVNKGNPEDEKRLGTSYSKTYPQGYVEPEYSRNQMWLMIDLITQNVSGNQIPPEALSPIMAKYINGCPTNYFILPKRGQDKPSASDTMASCLLQLASSYQIEKVNNIRQEEYRSPY